MVEYDKVVCAKIYKVLKKLKYKQFFYNKKTNKMEKYRNENILNIFFITFKIKMIFIKHRVNKIRDLKKLNKEYGVEIDIRSNGKNLYLHHDPYKKGESFIKWLRYYNHNVIVLNVKEEGLEDQIIKIKREI